jgi:hypothetical protein
MQKGMETAYWPKILLTSSAPFCLFIYPHI